MGLATAAIVALVGAVAYAQGSETRVTGGGQIVLSSSNPMAAEDTLTFEAHEFSNGSREQTTGEVEFVPTADESGQQVTAGYWHGQVQCVEVSASDGEAIIGGVKDQASSPEERGERFDIFIKDNPPDNANNDDIIVEDDGDGDCKIDNGDEFELFRGEAEITTRSGNSP